MLIIWTLVFIFSLAILIKGSDWLIESAEKIGLSMGLSSFIVGVTIVGIGTSFPELISSLFAVFQGATDVPIANAVGSNIANILLIVGISAIVGKKLMVTKSLIDLDLPLLATSTVVFLGTIIDRQITFGESVLLLVSFGVYFLYTIKHVHEDEAHNILSGEPDTISKPKLVIKDIVVLVFGILLLVVGAKYLIESLVVISQILNIATGVIAITAVAVGTSLPELLVSVKAAFQNKSDVALGNIFGSNVFNILVVIGLPGLFTTLTIDEQSFKIGVPALIVATFLFLVSGISKRIHVWEGVFFILIYVTFLANLFNWF